MTSFANLPKDQFKSKLTLSQQQIETAIGMYLEAYNLKPEKITFRTQFALKDHGELDDKYSAEVDFVADGISTPFSFNSTKR